MPNTDVLNLNTKGQRNLSMKDLKAWYTAEELEELRYNIKYPSNSKELPCDAKFLQPFDAMKALAKENDKRHRWTPKEDAFLIASYMFISDQIIALGLNMPSYAVTNRRTVLKLTKGHRHSIEVLVWCHRENFEEDMLALSLTKARPELADAH